MEISKNVLKYLENGKIELMIMGVNRIEMQKRSSIDTVMKFNEEKIVSDPIENNSIFKKINSQ